MNILQRFTEGVSTDTDSKQMNRKLLRLSVLYTFILGIVAHGFQFLNLDASHDWAIELYSDTDLYLYQVALGRLFEPVFRIFLSADVSTPWLTGLLSLGLISLAVYFVSRMFKLDKTYELLLVSGIMVTNQTLTSLASTYITWLGADMLAMLLAVIAAFLWDKSVTEKRYALLPAASLVLAFSIGFYQSFLAVCIVLIIFKCILRFLDNQCFRSVLCDGLLGIAVLAVGSVLYFVFMKVICHVTQAPVIEGTYNTVANVWTNTESFADRFGNTYAGTFGRLFGDDLITMYPAEWLRTVNILVFGIGFLFLVYICVQRRVKPLNIVPAVLLTALLPFAANIIRFLNTTIHDLMIYAFWLLFLFPLLLLHMLSQGTTESRLPQRLKNLLKAFLCILLGIVIYDNIQTANIAYLAKQSEYDATLSCMASVMYDVEHMPGYVEGETPVYILGSPTSAFCDLPYREHLVSLTGFSYKSAVTYDYKRYLRYFLFKEPYLLNESTNATDVFLREELDRSAKTYELSVYPNEGYVGYVNGVIVVRFPW